MSSVKQKIAQHLPVFLMEREKNAKALATDDGTADPIVISPLVDSQATNSVYLDNVHLGLYHTRITKQPHSIAIRLRWYGPDPTAGKVFVERKTHRESWTGEESVKERFALPHELIVPFLMGQHTWPAEEARLQEEYRRKHTNKSGGMYINAEAEPEMPAAELLSVKKLFNEVQRAVESKQLEPTLRTVYMRTAFQVPFDASVRCSLDTSLAMLCENPLGQPTCKMLQRWYRDPDLPLHRTEVTRFPHAVLEIKLALGPGEETPAWVQELINSGELTEVHKFSKFMHGCAVLFPDVVQEVPYWVDDVSLRQSIQQAASIDKGAVMAQAGLGMRRAHNRSTAGLNELNSPLLRSSNQSRAWDSVESTEEREARQEEIRLNVEMAGGRDFDGRDEGFLGNIKSMIFGKRRNGSLGEHVPRVIPMKIEPKTYFANERTFLSWLHTAVLIGTIGAGLASVHLGGGVKRKAGYFGGTRARQSPVLTIVHKHEYQVTYPRSANGSALKGHSPIVIGDETGESVTSTAVINETVAAAIQSYFQSLENSGAVAPPAAPSSDTNAEESASLIPLTVSMIMLCASVLLCLYATWTFVWRGRMIAKRSTVPFHDPIGPVVMGSIMIGAMSVLVILTAVKAGQGGD